jgi:hypothetical protein
MKTATYYIDCDEGHDLYEHDRTDKNHLAFSKYTVVTKFMERLMVTIDQMHDGDTLEITVKKAN